MAYNTQKNRLLTAGSIGFTYDKENWGRTRLSEELCRLWNWRTYNGRQGNYYVAY